MPGHDMHSVQHPGHPGHPGHQNHPSHQGHQNMPPAHQASGGHGAGGTAAGGSGSGAQGQGQQQQQQGSQRGGRHPMWYKQRPRRRPPQDCLPLNEAAKLEMANMATKTPVSVLQELLARRGTQPKYELVQIEGLIHEPIFRYRVTVADIVAIGTGRSKKQAKHKAAKGLLDKLIGETSADNTNGTPPETVDDSAESPYDLNPVGCLQEMCMRKFLPPPQYVTEHEEGGLPQDNQFAVACVLLNFREVGRGKSKKVAKRMAAHRMLQLLQDMPAGEGPASEAELGIKGGHLAARYADMKSSKISTLTTSQSHKVSQFHKHLKQSAGPVLAKLQVTPLNIKDFNYVQFLQEIATEQSFEVTYVDVEEKSVTGKMQCLVQLSTLPVAVCYGSGNTSKAAQSAAALNALEYLKIMTKK